MKRTSLTPIKLRLLLSGSIIAMLTIGIAMTAYGSRILSLYAAEVSKAAADANASRDTVTQLENLQEELRKNQDVIAKASKLMAKRTSYDYQNQVIKDLDIYATRAGVAIAGVTFSDLTSGASAGGTANAGSGAASGTTAAVSVTLASPINYTAYLNFLHYIEQSLVQTRLSDVNLIRDEQRPDQVTSSTLNLKVYVR